MLAAVPLLLAAVLAYGGSERSSEPKFAPGPYNSRLFRSCLPRPTSITEWVQLRWKEFRTGAKWELCERRRGRFPIKIERPPTY